MRDITKRLNTTVKDQKKEIPWSKVITNIQAIVLESLAIYKYLTLSQMLLLNVGTKDPRYIHRQVASLRDRRKPLVACSSYNSPQPRKGRVESMYYLTMEGENVLINELFYPNKSIKRPVGKSIVYRDYFHRKRTIDFQISLFHWIKNSEHTLAFFDTYFDYDGNNRVGKNLSAKTRIELSPDDYIIPDASFLIGSSPADGRLYLFEMHNGKDTGKLIRQIHQHAYALVERCTHKKYNLNQQKSYKVLLVFEHKAIMKALISRIKADGKVFDDIHKYFLCKSLEEIKDKEFGKNWQTIFGDQGFFYP